MAVQGDGRQPLLEMLCQEGAPLRVDLPQALHQRGIQRAGENKGFHQLAYDVLRVSCRPAVPGDEEFSAAGKTVADALRAGFDVLPAGQEGRIAVGECLKELFHKAWYIVRIFSA